MDGPTKVGTVGDLHTCDIFELTDGREPSGRMIFVQNHPGGGLLCCANENSPVIRYFLDNNRPVRIYGTVFQGGGN